MIHIVSKDSVKNQGKVGSFPICPELKFLQLFEKTLEI